MTRPTPKPFTATTLYMTHSNGPDTKEITTSDWETMLLALKGWVEVWGSYNVLLKQGNTVLFDAHADDLGIFNNLTNKA